jgi:transcriptional regulator with XRE-family HTH domain
MIPSGFPLGERLKALRLQEGISQRELARRAELTNGNLSQIEQGRVSPSVHTLEKLLAALHISLEDFFTSAEPTLSPVLAAAQWQQLHKPGVRHSLFAICEASAPSYLTLNQLSPGAQLRTDFQPHKGVMAGTLISGSLRLELDGQSHMLQPGDGFHFSPQRRFALHNPGPGMAKWVGVSLLPNLG